MCMYKHVLIGERGRKKERKTEIDNLILFEDSMRMFAAPF